MLNITSYCEPKDIYLNMDTPACNKNSDCIQYFVEKIKSFYTETEIATIRKDLLERETICSTAIGNSIAVPHCRSNLSIFPALKIFRPITPVNHPDKGPIKLFFLMILPLSAKNEHLTILSKIAKLSKNSDWIEKLFLAPDQESFYKDLQMMDKTLSTKK